MRDGRRDRSHEDARAINELQRGSPACPVLSDPHSRPGLISSPRTSSHQRRVHGGSMSVCRAGRGGRGPATQLRFAVIITAMLLLPALARAQMTRGGINGTVRDTSGGVVPGATVTVTNADTNQARDAVTDAQGFYRISALEPGSYNVRTVLSGFQTIEIN